MDNNKSVLKSLFSTRARDDVAYVAIGKIDGTVWYTGDREFEEAVQQNDSVYIDVITASGERQYSGEDHANRLKPLMSQFLQVKSDEVGSRDLRGSKQEYLVNPRHIDYAKASLPDIEQQIEQARTSSNDVIEPSVKL